MPIISSTSSKINMSLLHPLYFLNVYLRVERVVLNLFSRDLQDFKNYNIRLLVLMNYLKAEPFMTGEDNMIIT